VLNQTGKTPPGSRLEIIEKPSKEMARPERFELPTFCFEGTFLQLY